MVMDVTTIEANGLPKRPGQSATSFFERDGSKSGAHITISSGHTDQSEGLGKMATIKGSDPDLVHMNIIEPSKLRPPDASSTLASILGSRSDDSNIASCSSGLSFSALSRENSSSDVSQTISNKDVVPLDMMPTIPLIPVQIPISNRGGMVTLQPKARGRPRGLSHQFGTLRSALSSSRGRMKAKKLNQHFGRGSRRLAHSVSLDDRGLFTSHDDLYSHDDELHFSHDDMYVNPSYQEKWPGKVCAFCALGESSQFGIGGLIRYQQSQGFSPVSHFPGEDITKEELPLKKLKLTPYNSREHIVKSRKLTGESCSDTMAELNSVGHVERPMFVEIFSNDGYCFAHGTCALWASESEKKSDGSLSQVDKAAIDALERKCKHCQKFGASISCKVAECDDWFHFPCATAIGLVMDLKDKVMLCNSHANQASLYGIDLTCSLCEESGEEVSVLFCCTCGKRCHTSCLKPNLKVTPIIRSGWQCPQCKSCQMCRQAIHRQSSDEVVCGVCDRAYHLNCARPQGLTHPRNDWKCKSCRVCGDCGSRTPGNGLSSKWHVNFSVCDSCYQLRNKGLACPICKKAYRAIMQKTMAQCTICKRYVHSHCDSDADLGIIQAKIIGDSSYEYNCTVCRTSPTARLQASTLLSTSMDRDSLTESMVLSEDSIDSSLTQDDVLTSPRKPSQYSGLSLLANSSFTSYNASSSHPNLSSLCNRGKPFVSRRGFLSRNRGGAVTKCGKKSFSSRGRGGKSSFSASRRGRGNANRGYRSYFNYQPTPLQVMDNSHSTGKEEGEENKMIIVNSDRKYCLMQDICTMCGSIGLDREARLLACAQCGQCYHPICIKLTVSKVMLEKGWRCLDCTVCEGCGERNDEPRLVLCEDCDISCHIYCMEPPLDAVPAGIWKCKWCAVCQECGSKDPGINSTWKDNYSKCGPCASMTACSLCDDLYKHNELIVRCSNCSRWLHAADDNIHTPDEAERCTRQDYLCPGCRTPDSLPPHIPSTSPSRRLERERHNSSSFSLALTSAHSSMNSFSPNRSNSPIDYMPKPINQNPHAQHLLDGTLLSDSGLHHIQNLMLQPLKKSRNSKGLRTSRGISIDSTGSKDFDDDEDDEEEKLDGQHHWVYGMKEGTMLNAREHGNPPVLPEGFYTLPGNDTGTFVLRKKRCRNIKTVGIGGFQVKGRGKKDEDKAKEEAELDPQKLELRRKRSKWRTKKKIPLLDKFPSYIQEAFFGRNLMDTSGISEANMAEEDLKDTEDKEVHSAETTTIKLSQDEVKLIHAAKEKHEQLLKADVFPTCSNMENENTPCLIKQENLPSISLSKTITVTSTSTTVTSVKVEEKETKEEKMDDLVEDKEDNDAIEAIFFSDGDDFLSDAIVRDLMKEDIKDEVDKDQMDSVGVAGGQLSDLLGPGFSLDDVDDLMKNLPEDTNEESQPVDSVQIARQTSIQSTTASDVVNAVPAVSHVVQQPPSNPITSNTMRDQLQPGSAASIQQTRFPLNSVRPNAMQTGIPPQNMYPSRPTHYNENVVQSHNIQKTVMNTQMVNNPSRPQMNSNIIQNKVVMGSYNQSTNSQLLRTQTPVTPVASPYPSPMGYCVEGPMQSPINQDSQKTWSGNENQSLSLSLEEDEALGDKATKAAVLYTNINKPSIKNDSSSIQDKERQIKKVWKNLHADERKFYTQKARENKKEYFKNKNCRNGRSITTTQSIPAPDNSSPQSSLSPCLSPLDTDIPSGSPSQPSCSSAPQCFSSLSPDSVRAVSTHVNKPAFSYSTCTNSEPKITSIGITSCFSLTSTYNSIASVQSSNNVLTCLPYLPPSLSLIPSNASHKSNTKVSHIESMKLTDAHTSVTGQLKPTSVALTNTSNSDIARKTYPVDSDHHIRVLTPLEIMRTLPVLERQDVVSSPPTLSPQYSSSPHTNSSPLHSSYSSPLSSSSPQSVSSSPTVSTNIIPVEIVSSVTTNTSVSTTSNRELQRAMKSQDKESVGVVVSSPNEFKTGVPSAPMGSTSTYGLQNQVQRVQVQQTVKRTVIGMPGIPQHNMTQNVRMGIPVRTAEVPLNEMSGQVTILRHQAPISGGQILQQSQTLSQGNIQKHPSDLNNRPSTQEYMPSSSQGYSYVSNMPREENVIQMSNNGVPPQQNMLRDVLQKTSPNWEDSNQARPQFRQPLPPLPIGQQQVRLRMSSQFQQGFQVEPRMRQYFHQQKVQQPSHPQSPNNPTPAYPNSQAHGQQLRNLHINLPNQQLSNISNAETFTSQPTSQALPVVSELPESVSRDIESLAQGNSKDNTKDDIEDIEASTDLQSMDVDLLSTFGTNWKELLDLAEADQERERGSNEKMTTTLFDSIEECSKEAEGERSSSNGSLSQVKPNSLTFNQSKSPPVQNSSAQGNPENPSAPNTPGTPGTKSPMTMGPSQSPLTGSPRLPLPNSPQSQMHRNSPHLTHLPQGFPNSPIQRHNAPMPSQGVRQFNPMQNINQNQGLQRIPNEGQLNSMASKGMNPTQIQRPGNMGTHRPLLNVDSQGHPIQASRIVNQVPQGGPPPPPYNPVGSFQKTDVLTGDGLLVRTPLGSPIGMGPSMMRPHPHSPIMGNPSLMMGPQLRMPPNSHMGVPPPHRRSLLLQEQPLLIEEIIEAEKREQMQQQKAIVVQQGMSPNMPQNYNEGPGNRPIYQANRFPNANTGNQMYMTPGPSQHMQRSIRPPAEPGLHPALIQAGSRPTQARASHMTSNSVLADTIKSLPAPPVPLDNPVVECDFQQQAIYEKWLTQQSKCLQAQLNRFETEINQLRRQKKSFNSRQRTLKKNKQELSEHDQQQFMKVQRDAVVVQRQVEACRRAARQHANIVAEYNKKHSKQVAMIQTPSPTGMVPSGQGIMSGSPSPLHSTPQSPLMSHSPSSQHSMGSMVSSPHTPAASPGHIPVPQHSPHGVVPSALASPSDHGPFSPRMASSGTPSYTGQVIGGHHMMMPQSIKVRMPVHSPGTSVVQPGAVSPHMMAMKQGYQQVPNMMNQVSGQQMMMRHPYTQGAMPMRRASGSGAPVASPSPSQGGMSPMHGAPPMSPITNAAMKPSPVHSGGLRSPVPLASPQMRPHSTENPGTPLTPRSVETFGNPLTPIEQANFQMNSPHHAIHTSTPPSPIVAPHTNSSNPMETQIDNHGRIMRQNSNGGGNGYSTNAPIPFFNAHDSGESQFMLKGGGFKKDRFGNWKIGLKGGQPTTDTPSSASCTQSMNPPNSELRPNENMAINSNQLDASMSFRGPCSTVAVTPLSYVSAGSTIAGSIATQLSAANNIVVPEPAKSEIPPSSRHQAVIGIPGGGAISNPTAMYSSNPVGAQSGSQHSSLPSYTSQLNSTGFPTCTVQDSQPTLSMSNRVSAFSTATASLVPTPIMSLSVSDSVPMKRVQSVQMSESLAKEVNTLVNVVSASSQISNVIMSSNSSIGGLPPVSSLNSHLSLMQTSSGHPGSSVSASHIQQKTFINSTCPTTLFGTTGHHVQENFVNSSVWPRMTTRTQQVASHGLPDSGTSQSLAFPSHRFSQSHTLHHLPQNKVFATANNTTLSQNVQLASNASGTQAVSAVPPNKVVGSTVMLHTSGQNSQQIVQLPSMSSGQINRPQLLQSVSQYGSLGQNNQGTQLIVQQQHPSGMMFATNGSHVRMVGQQVMMPQGLLRGTGVMVKSNSQQQGLRMMMIHNNKPRAPTPPPVSRQPSPMMPPPSTRSPAPHVASPGPRVSPAPSPIAQSPGCPSPQSPLIKTQSLNNSPIPSPHQSLTPPIQMITNRENATHSDESRLENMSDASSKDASASNSPNVLLKQLLQSASCAGNAVSPGQLVLVRSSPSTNMALSQLATQVPNATAVPRPVQDVKSTSPFMNKPQNIQHSVMTTVCNKTIGQSNVYYNTQTVLSNGRQTQNCMPMRTIGSNVPQSSVLSPMGLQQNTSAVPMNNQMPKNMPMHLTSSCQVVMDTRRPQSVSHYAPGKLVTNQMQKVQGVPMTIPSNQGISERCDNSSSLNSEMCVMIPENVGPTNSGELTPELQTPDGFEDNDEARKARKRVTSQVRRKSQSKDNKVNPPKRMRQGSRIEEDHDSFIDNMLSELRRMPTLSISDAEVTQTINPCPMYGSTNTTKSPKKEMALRKGMLKGTEEGKLWIKDIGDYYNTQPFGRNAPMVLPTKSSPLKGFYNQEFTPPMIGFATEDHQYDVEVLCFTKQACLPSRDTNSPDTVFSSSSPECITSDSPPPFKGLKLTDMDDDTDDHKDRSTSPMIPIIPPISSKISRMSTDLNDKENEPSFLDKIGFKSKIGLTPALPLRGVKNVNVCLTLSGHAAQDVSHVLRSLANILNIPPPTTYDLTSFPVEPVSKFKRYLQRFGVDGKEEQLELQNVLNGSITCCKSCNAVMASGGIVKSREEMPLLRKEIWNTLDVVAFCSKTCYEHFISLYRIEEKLGLPPTYADSVHSSRLKTKDNTKDLESKNVTQLDNSNIGLPNITNRFLKRKFDSSNEAPVEKRPRRSAYKYWSRDTTQNREVYTKPSDKEVTDMLFRMQITYRQQGLPDDSRQCSLCHLYGDYLADGSSRLLNYDVDKWVHLNCVLWCEDVYETLSGSLMLVEMGLKKAQGLICVHCDLNGASVKCFKARCNKFYHLHCAVKEGCTFYMNKTVYCQEHNNKGEKDNELPTLAVHRRVYIDRDESRQIASVMHHTEMNQVIRIGSLILLNIGLLLPHQLQAFHTPYCLYPVGYQAIRFYWSMRQLNKRCAYECSIQEVDSQPQFRIVVKEDGFDDITFISRSPKGAWNKILEPIAEMRQRNNVIKLFPQYISGEDLFGLTEPIIVRILESMPGVDSLPDYTFKYGSNPLFELPLAVNPTGSARSESYNRTVTKRHHGIRTTVGSVKTGNNPRTAATLASYSLSMDPFVPFGKSFTHSRFFGYKKMKNEWRSNVYLARSKIQGLGLYAARDIEKNTMIIEYIGEIIRSELSEIREKRYEAQNRGIYMFRLDDTRVVDATVSGGLARYINHCCDPSCYTETVEIEKDYKIIIISNRKILRGEELAYDYKFDEEEDHKIPCLCGAENCRKWMN